MPMNYPDYQSAQRQTVGDDVIILHAEPESMENLSESTPETWNSYNLLSLGDLIFFVTISMNTDQPSLTDGGGIRGYWSLLALDKLMEYIAVKEEKDNDETHCSFSPEGWPENVSQVPLTEEELNEVSNASNSSKARARATSKTRRYLPCHYFDYIGGSSTGA